MGRFPTRAALAAALALTLVPEIAVAQSRPELIPVPGRIKMALYRPDSGPAPTVGIIVMHRTSNYLTHRACTELSRRGFLMLCMNSRFENNEPAVDFEQLPLDVKQGVEFLRKQPGISKVVLFAHSGGGPIMALYQAVAEKGVAYCKGEAKLTQCTDQLAGLPPVDGIVFTDAHPGNAINLLRGINPSVANENNPPDAPPIAGARSVQSRERLQPQRTVELFHRIPGPLFPGAGRAHEPADRRRARQARSHEAERLPLPRRRRDRDPARRQSGLGTGRLGGPVHRDAEHRRRQ